MLKRLKRDEGIILVVLIFIAAFSFLFDELAFSSLDSIRNTLLDSFMSFVSSPITITAIVLFIFINLSMQRSFKAVKKLVIAGVSSSIAGSIIKIIIARPRPFGLEKSIPLINYPDFSFPSNHAFVAFSMLPVMSDRYPRLKIMFFILAATIAAARFYTGMHFFSDIAAGAALGYLVGLYFLRKA